MGKILMFGASKESDASATNLNKSFRAELERMRHAMQTLARLTDGSDVETARRMLVAAMASFDARLTEAIPAILAMREKAPAAKPR